MVLLGHDSLENVAHMFVATLSHCLSPSISLRLVVHGTFSTYSNLAGDTSFLNCKIAQETIRVLICRIYFITVFFAHFLQFFFNTRIEGGNSGQIYCVAKRIYIYIAIYKIWWAQLYIHSVGPLTSQRLSWLFLCLDCYHRRARMGRWFE